MSGMAPMFDSSKISAGIEFDNPRAKRADHLQMGWKRSVNAGISLGEEIKKAYLITVQLERIMPIDNISK
jgi:hypothetical protein